MKYFTYSWGKFRFLTYNAHLKGYFGENETWSNNDLYIQKVNGGVVV